SYPSRVASLVARFPIPCLLPRVRGIPYGLMLGWKPPTTPGLLVARSPNPGIGSRREVALPSSRVTPLHACPALRPRWCPAHSPCRIQDCCLPATARRRLSLATALRTILLTTTIHISGLHHAACILVPSSFVLPLLGVHVDFTADLLARLWSGGICSSRCAPTG